MMRSEINDLLRKGSRMGNGLQMASYGSTAFTYDGLGRCLSKQESGKKEITYTYDSNGRVV